MGSANERKRYVAVSIHRMIPDKWKQTLMSLLSVLRYPYVILWYTSNKEFVLALIGMRIIRMPASSGMFLL